MKITYPEVTSDSKKRPGKQKKLKIFFSINKVFQICLKCLKPKINAEIHSLEECQSK